MLNLTSKELVEVVGSSSEVIDCVITNASRDSRDIKAGDLFIAIKGENFDGHNFVLDVLEKGVGLVLVSKLIKSAPQDRQVVVEDTIEAFGKIAGYMRNKFAGVIVGLTGSAGKTTTKEEIKFVLQNYGKVFATKGNHNNFIGVPISICDMPEDVDYSVLEMGMSAEGEIRYLTNIIKPDIAIITNIHPMHIEFFDEYEGIARAKGEIFEGFKESSVYKTAVINADTDFADLLFDLASDNGAYNIISYGKSDNAVIKLISIEERDDKSFVKISIAKQEYEYMLTETGEHKVYNSLSVLAVCYALGLDIQKSADLLKDFGALDGRGKEYKLHNYNGEEYMLIDDSYSGQPEAMRLALKGLNGKKVKGRRVAVLGKMAELGDKSEKEHISVGKLVAELNIDIVIGVCEETKIILEQIPDNVEKHYFETKDGLGEELYNNILRDGDALLIKGARYSSRVFEVAKYLVDNGSK